MAEFQTQINSVTKTLHTIAERIGASKASADLHELADRVQHKLEVWHEAVDAWLVHETENLKAAKDAAFAEYRKVRAEAQSVIDAHRANKA